METATSAAAVGGITTVVDMPLNSDPTTTTVELLQKKISATTVSLHHCSRAEQTQVACSSEGSTAVLKTFIMCSPLDRKALGDLQVGERSVTIAYKAGMTFLAWPIGHFVISQWITLASPSPLADGKDQGLRHFCGRLLLSALILALSWTDGWGNKHDGLVHRGR